MVSVDCLDEHDVCFCDHTAGSACHKLTKPLLLVNRPAHITMPPTLTVSAVSSYGVSKIIISWLQEWKYRLPATPIPSEVATPPSDDLSVADVMDLIVLLIPDTKGTFLLLLIRTQLECCLVKDSRGHHLFGLIPVSIPQESTIVVDGTSKTKVMFYDESASEAGFEDTLNDKLVGAGPMILPKKPVDVDLLVSDAKRVITILSRRGMFSGAEEGAPCFEMLAKT